MQEGESLETTAQGQRSLLVVNLRGMVNTRVPVRRALEQLHLVRRFNATIVPESKDYLGMLRLCKEHVAWTVANAELVEKLLKQRGEISDGRRVTEETLGVDGKPVSFKNIAQLVASGKIRLDGTQGFRQFFRLSSPRGGFHRSVRRQYPAGGILGPNPELGSLVDSMLPNK